MPHPIFHFIVSAVIAAFLWPSIGWFALLAFAGGFLIDLDHFFVYIARGKGLDFIKAYYFFLNREEEWVDELFVFHNIELVFLATIIPLYFPFLLACSAALSFWLEHPAMKINNDIIIRQIRR